MTIAAPGRARVAYHEAGHVVATIASGCRVLSAGVWGDDPEGATDYETDSDGPHFLEHELRIRLAGVLAGRRGAPAFGYAGCRGDLQEATGLAGRLTNGEPVNEVMQRQMRGAEEWLFRPDVWMGVEAIATGLLARGMLDRAAVLSILSAATNESRARR